jgi:hypothetical protein
MVSTDNLQTRLSMEAMTNRQHAIEIFGKAKVAEVEAIVYISDPDMAYTTLQDMGDEDGAEIVSMLCFEND